MTSVQDVMAPVGESVYVTRSLEDVQGLISRSGRAVIVLNLCHVPVGIITEAVLEEWIARRPQTWRKNRCACVIPEIPITVGAEADTAEVAQALRSGDAHPAMVLSGDHVVGVLSAADIPQHQKVS